MEGSDFLNGGVVPDLEDMVAEEEDGKNYFMLNSSSVLEEADVVNSFFPDPPSSSSSIPLLSNLSNRDDEMNSLKERVQNLERANEQLRFFIQEEIQKQFSALGNSLPPLPPSPVKFRSGDLPSLLSLPSLPSLPTLPSEIPPLVNFEFTDVQLEIMHFALWGAEEKMQKFFFGPFAERSPLSSCSVPVWWCLVPSMISYLMCSYPAHAITKKQCETALLQFPGVKTIKWIPSIVPFRKQVRVEFVLVPHQTWLQLISLAMENPVALNLSPEGLTHPRYRTYGGVFQCPFNFPGSTYNDKLPLPMFLKRERSAFIWDSKHPDFARNKMIMKKVREHRPKESAAPPPSKRVRSPVLHHNTGFLFCPLNTKQEYKAAQEAIGYMNACVEQKKEPNLQILLDLFAPVQGAPKKAFFDCFYVYNNCENGKTEILFAPEEFMPPLNVRKEDRKTNDTLDGSNLSATWAPIRQVAAIPFSLKSYVSSVWSQNAPASEKACPPSTTTTTPSTLAKHTVRSTRHTLKKRITNKRS
jgi:hypothetical protein